MLWSKRFHYKGILQMRHSKSKFWFFNQQSVMNFSSIYDCLFGSVTYKDLDWKCEQKMIMVFYNCEGIICQSIKFTFWVIWNFLLKVPVLCELFKDRRLQFIFKIKWVYIVSFFNFEPINWKSRREIIELFRTELAL